MEQRFGSPIFDKNNIEIWVRRAQAAVLSPHKHQAEFETMSKAELKALMEHDKEILQFSKNVVVIKIMDPDATDLSFVDLPGLIQNAKDERLISTVKSLVEGYIQGSNSLIVIAMPATDDYENLQAVTIAKSPKADPEGDRTIGVITKPDMLGENNIGARKNWKETLDGTRHPTTHGYFCVRLPDDLQREAGITKEEVQENADAYFSSTLPWNQMTDRSRFGIPNFVQYVSKLLVDLIEKSLPSLRGRVDEKLQQCLTDLEGIPPLPQGHPSTEVLMRITNFCRAINDAVSGEKYKHFVQSNLVTYSKFKSEIIATAPEFRPFEGSALSLEKTRRCSSCITFVPGSQTEARGLDIVRNRIKLSITWELPGHIPFEVTKNLLHDYIDLWAEPTLDCFQAAKATTTQLLIKLLQEYLGQYKFFQKYISDLVFKEHNDCGRGTDEMLQKILQMEKNPLCTQNSDVLSSQRREWKDSLLREAGRMYSEELQQEKSTYHRCSTSRRSYIRHTFASVFSRADDHRPTTWTIDDEIEIMAGVQAYFHVAYQRIIDYIPLTIEHELNQNLANNIGNALIDKVMQDTTEHRVTFEQLLSEDPVIAAKREELQNRRSRLLKIKAVLDKFKHLEPIAPSIPSSPTVEMEEQEEEYDAPCEG
ncbi:P-loop containing nucleoside triphosphate hydrolase protein [Crepidotus variabilis]|uniref:P-loop containing nucleoside triphosphate hydrolase protein n=1 Tax=Crepidotus variabilis TaxID=179855 RepID=A0A9P6JL43_9AGAR|nr:P-loop containing nucleoside triphosphate hydrolase protein [Crepidotus variabilis]